MSADDQAVQAIRAFCDANNINPYSSNGPDGGDMAVFGVGAMDVERQWPQSHFARLAAAIRAKWPGLQIVLTGAPSEALIVQAVMSDEAAPAGLIEKSGPLDEAVALIGRARAYIGNDTSLLNIAAACGRPLGFLRKPSRWTIVPASFRWHCLTAGSARPGRSAGSRRSRLFQS
ncbi:MAG: glycosyltransferase family 9 protein [Pseudomonadota bacterium]|nr:glycosyltransferase family 9 protein [Pseudomonadota bacterium]